MRVVILASFKTVGRTCLTTMIATVLALGCFVFTLQHVKEVPSIPTLLRIVTLDDRCIL